jgi:hypothetical protein
MKTKILFYFFLISFTFCLFSCDTNDPPPPPPPVEEKVENTITVETVWQDLDALQIKFSKSGIDSLSMFSYYLYVNGKEEKRYTSISNETVYTDTGLTEGTEYRYSVKAYEGEELKDTSNVLQTETLSTTSHEIEWEVDTLGVPGDHLRDVWGLDENNVWAVGGLNLSEGGTVMIKWDGNKWEGTPLPNGNFNGIYGFSDTEIWCAGVRANQAYIGNWNGSNWKDYDWNYFQSQGFTAYPLNAIWGSSPEDIWAVGREGTIVHWDGEKWKKVDLSLPEDFIFWDIHGTDANNVYAAGNVENEEYKLFHYDGTQWNEILSGESGGNLQPTVYSPRRDVVYFLDLPLFRIVNGVTEEITLPDQRSAIYKIRGSGTNSIVTAGVYTEVFYYNGSNWTKQEELYQRFNNEILEGVTVIGNKVFCVGTDFGEGAIAIRGKIK